MPELPEVENLKQGLERYILGQKILSIEVTKPKLVSGKGTLRSPSKKKVLEFVNNLKLQRFIAVERRAKNLIFKLTNDKIILAHLKMTGQFVYKSRSGKNDVSGGHTIEASETTLPNKHTHIMFELENGVLYYNDTRMFGYVLFYPTLEHLDREKHFEKIGLEPLDDSFTIKYFSDSLKSKKSKIKSVLMSQEIVTGVGNIYTDESLFEAGIRPERLANSLKKEEVKKLYKAIKRIITRAIKTGGSSVATYRLVDETRGNYAREHKVYGKNGLPCVKCKTKLKKILIGSRTTVYCARCQK